MRHHVPTQGLIVLAVLAGGVQLGHTQTPEPEQETDVEKKAAGTVVTKDTQVSGELAPNARRVERISSKDLTRRGATTLAEALEWLSAGSSVSPTGTASGLVIDGLPSGQLTVLRDGMPISRPSGSPQGPLVDLDSIPINPAAIERIDVYRGVGPVGSGAAGGIVVDIITRRQKSKHSAFAHGQWMGAQSALARHQYSLGGGISLPGHVRWDMMGSWQGIDALDINNDTTPDTPWRRNLYGETAVTWRANRNEYLRLQLIGNRGQTKSLGAADAPLDDQIIRRMIRARVQGRWWIGNQMRVDHHSDLGQQRHDFSKIVRSSAFVRPKATTTQWGTTHTGALTWFAKKHDVAVELNGAHQRIERTGETGTLPTVSINTLGVGLSDTWYMTKTLETFSRVHLNVSSAFAPGVQAHVGGVWKITPAIALRMSVSRSQRQPTAEELYLFFDHSEVGYRIRGNEQLDPEKLNSLSSGLILTAFQRQLGLEIKGFYNRLSDAITIVATPEDAALFTYDNLAEVETAGVQLTTQLKRLPFGLQLLGNYTFLPLARDQQTGERLNARSYHSGRVELKGAWFSQRLEAWTDVQTRSEMQVPAGSPGAPAYVLWGAGMGVRLANRAHLTIDANNLFDQRNATWGPAPGFNVLAQVRLGFQSARAR